MIEIHDVLTDEARSFLADLQRTFGARRVELLARREERLERLHAGELPDFLPETAESRAADLRVAPPPDEIADRRVEITGPVERTISLDTGEKQYALADDPAVLFVRPRLWHLEERHQEVDGAPMSGSLFDFGLYFFRNHGRNGRYFYVPKLESRLEA